MAKCKKCGEELHSYEKEYCDACWEIIGPQKRKAKDQWRKDFRSFHGSPLATSDTRNPDILKLFSDEIWLKDYWLNVLIVSLIALSMLMMVVSYAFPWTQGVNHLQTPTK